jgi:PAS domain S-box-containing protein
MRRVAREVLANVDLGLLGRSMLDAAAMARIGVVVTIVDPDAPHNVYVNEAAARIIGWPIEEMLERHPLHYVAARDMPRMLERFARRSRGEQGQSAYEIAVTRKDGSETSIEITASHATLDGKPAVFAFIIDVGARREAES